MKDAAPVTNDAKRNNRYCPSARRRPLAALDAGAERLPGLSLHQQPDGQSDGDVDQACQPYCPGQTEKTDEEETACQYADCRAQAVREIEQRKDLSRFLRHQPYNAGAHQRKGHPEQDRLGQNQQGGQCPFVGIRGGSGVEQRNDAGIGELHSLIKDGMEKKCGQADQTLRQRVAEQQLLPPHGISAANPGTEGHPAHEDGQDQCLGIGRVSEKELQVMGPDRFVDES